MLRTHHSLMGCALALVLTWALLHWPRAVYPVLPPALSLPPEQVQQQLKTDHLAAQRLKHIQGAHRLEKLFLASGQAERQPLESGATSATRQAQVAALVRDIQQRQGSQALAIMRAHAVESLELVLKGTITGEEAAARLGTFPNLLAFHGATYRGKPIAPHFVVRTLYKARWNTLHGLAHPEGFSPIEGRAYFGWLSFHAPRLSIPYRLAALPDYAATGGDRATEGAATLLFLSGQHERALTAMHAAYQEQPSLRLRNHLRGIRLGYSGPPLQQVW